MRGQNLTRVLEKAVTTIITNSEVSNQSTGTGWKSDKTKNPQLKLISEADEYRINMFVLIKKYKYG